MLPYETFSVAPSHREPLIRWIVGALEASGCRVLRASEPDVAPFRLSFETPIGERLGILAYAFLANAKPTKNRPSDEHRFQVKYGPDTKLLHELWQDPFELYTTLFFGVNLERGFFVAADPLLHSPTRFFISVEYKAREVEELLARGWHAWEREKRGTSWKSVGPVETLVGGTRESFLRFIRFERAAKGLDPGHRQLLADRLISAPSLLTPQELSLGRVGGAVPHALVDELGLGQEEILDLIASAPRLKMAVRGWVAEVHLESALRELGGVSECSRIEGEGEADISLRYRGSRPLRIECKNVLRKRPPNGPIRLDFQRTRASKADPCSRFYAKTDFDLVAACLHSWSELWEFRYALPRELDPHRHCPGKLSNLVRIDERWMADAERALAAAAAA